VKASRLSAEDRDRLRGVRVLIEYVRIELDSTLISGAANQRLIRDVQAIPDRFLARLVADIETVKKAQQNAKRRQRREQQ